MRGAGRREKTGVGENRGGRKGDLGAGKMIRGRK